MTQHESANSFSQQLLYAFALIAVLGGIFGRSANAEVVYTPTYVTISGNGLLKIGNMVLLLWQAADRFSALGLGRDLMGQFMPCPLQVMVWLQTVIMSSRSTAVS